MLKPRGSSSGGYDSVIPPPVRLKKSHVRCGHAAKLEEPRKKYSEEMSTTVVRMQDLHPTIAQQLSDSS
jgi:hypothetical protein